MASDLKLADTDRYRIREATTNDVSAMTEVFFHSFNAPFWQYFMADNPANRQWWDKGWTMGIESPTDISFVVEDTQSNNRIVAFSRWMTPQKPGVQERKCWPEMKEEEGWDMDLVGPFFGGMVKNRHELMGDKSHWFLEMLGVHEDYHKQGIAARLMKYGTDQADRDGLWTYLDASEKGQPYYKGWHNYQHGKDIDIPDRPQYGHYHYISLIRPPQK